MSAMKDSGRADGVLDELRHMALDAGDANAQVDLLHLGLLEMAALAGGLKEGHVILAGRDDGRVRIVAIDAIDQPVLAGEQVAVLVAGVLDEAIGGHQFAGHVAGRGCIPDCRGRSSARRSVGC